MYEFKTTFWDDFSIAEKSGISAINDTFNRAFKEWGEDIVYITELALVTNWKCWDYWKMAEKSNSPNIKKVCEVISAIYSDFYYKVRDFVYDHYAENEEAITYYFNTTD